MTRDGFMKELAYLLQDIQDEDKEDALQYYMDYFDEAGPEREDEVIRELGSPERIAAIIRSDIATWKTAANLQRAAIRTNGSGIPTIR